MGALHSETAKKDWWDKISSITPLLLGVAVTGLGTYLGALHNQRQDKLAEITALEKYQSLLSSGDAAKRELGYASFVALGYEKLALRMVNVTQDQAAKQAVEAIKGANTSNATLSENADETLDGLAKSDKLNQQASEKLRDYWKPNGVVDPAHSQDLNNWLQSHDGGVDIATFLYSSTYAHERAKAVQDLIK